jgi:hypothetical protein
MLAMRAKPSVSRIFGDQKLAHNEHEHAAAKPARPAKPPVLIEVYIARRMPVLMKGAMHAHFS